MAQGTAIPTFIEAPCSLCLRLSTINDIKQHAAELKAIWAKVGDFWSSAEPFAKSMTDTTTSQTMLVVHQEISDKRKPVVLYVASLGNKERQWTCIRAL
eukprot:7667463-Ditylum_brightwellii.AAC.1